MALKYFLVRHEVRNGVFGTDERQYVFVVSPEEELRFRTTFKEHRPDLTITKPKNITLEEIASELHQVLSNKSILVVSATCYAMKDVAKLACEAHLRGVRVSDVDTALVELSNRVGTEPEQMIRALMNGAVHRSTGVRVYSAIKNVLEPLAALTLLLLISPILLVVSLMVRFTSPGPVFYTQTRLGLRSKPFEIVKFRSMRTDAEKDGPVWASAKTGDARLSPIGGFLRATHLDELPQLWNVVRGDISIIGPRPERPVFTDQLEKEIPLFRLRTMVKPGITGWAQIRQGYANSIDDSRVKLEYDFYYILKQSPLLDIKVVFNTVGVLLTGGTEGKKRERTLAQAGEVQRTRLSLRRPFSALRLPRRASNSAALPSPREVSRRV